MDNKWDEYFMRIAREAASLSKDPSTQCGAVIVGPDRTIRGTGFNGFARGVRDDERLHDRETKLKMIIHAEINAIICARGDLRGCTIYVWPLPPCAQCAACIIQAGIRRVVAPDPAPSDSLLRRWGEHLRLASDMYCEVGVIYFEVEGE